MKIITNSSETLGCKKAEITMNPGDTVIIKTTGELPTERTIKVDPKGTPYWFLKANRIQEE